MSAEEIISSVFVENRGGHAYYEFNVFSDVKLPKGKKDGRFRKTTRIKYCRALEKNMFEKAYELYLGYFDSVENKTVVLFRDIADLALAEAESGRKRDLDSKMYQSIMKEHVLPYFGDMPLAAIKVKDIRVWVLDQGGLEISQSTFNKRFYCIKRVLDYSNENEYTLSNVIQHVKRTSPLFRKRESNDDKFYTQEEADLMLHDTYEGSSRGELRRHNFINCYVHIGLLLGCRSGEISGLKFSDIDWEQRTITIQRSITKGLIGTTKTGTSRTLPLVDRLHNRLLKHKETAICEWMFPNFRTKMPYTDTRTINDHFFKKMLLRLSIPYKGLYQLRHTFTTLNILNGAKLTTISKILGHKGGTEVLQKHYLRLGNTNQDAIRDELESLIA